MSLVNDLLIELDRNREGSERSETASLDGLSPNAATQPEGQSRGRHFPLVLSLITAGGIGFASAHFGSSSSPVVDKHETLADTLSPITIPAVSQSSPNFEELPRVSAPRPSPGLGNLDPAALQKSIANTLADPTLGDEEHLRIDRPVALRDVQVKQTGAITRVEIATDRDAAYRVEQGRSDGVFNVVLSETTLREPLPMLDLFGTAIRSIQTQLEDDSIRLEFTLDSDSHVQSQRFENSDGTLLIIDFQPAERSSIQTANSLPSLPSRKAAPKSTPSAGVKKKSKRAKTNMKISRSASDQKRSHQDTARLSAERTVEAARSARKNGDLETAATLYETARAASPGHTEAVIEGVETLNELGRVDQALELILNARRLHPNSSIYLMVHAKLLATQNLQNAITLLDTAGLSVESAPEVQALTAAYLQKSGQHGSAIERYESILRRYPKRPESWMGLGISLEARGRVMEAVDAYRIAMQLGELPGRSRGWISARIDALNEES